MVVLNALGEKVVQLLKYLEQLRERNSTLLREKKELLDEKMLLEARIKEGRENIEGSSEKKFLTREVIDSLIGNIEAIVEGEKRNHE